MMIVLNLGVAIEAKLSALAAMNGQTIEETACAMIHYSLIDAEPSREFHPNQKTLQALEEGQSGKFEGRASSIEEFFVELNRE